MDRVRSLRKTKGQRRAHKISEIFTAINFHAISLQNVPGLILRLFWVVVYFAGTVMTLLTCIDLYTKSRENPLASSVVTMHNGTIILPDSTICVPFTNAEAWMDFLRGGKNELDFYTDELNLFFNETETWHGMQEQQWPIQVIYLTQNYLSLIFYTENMRGYGSNLLNNTFSATDAKLQVISEVFVPQMIAWKVKLGELKEDFGKKFLDWVPITVTYNSKAHSVNLTKLMIIFASKQEVCYKLSFNEVQMKRNDNITIAVNQRKMQVAVVTDAKYYCVTVCPDYDAPVVFELNGKANNAGNIMSKGHPLTLFGELMMYRFVEINPFVQYVSLPDSRGGSTRCSQNNSREDCEIKCRRDVIEELCSCSVDNVRQNCFVVPSVYIFSVNTCSRSL